METATQSPKLTTGDNSDSTTTIALDAARVNTNDQQAQPPTHILIIPFGTVESAAGGFVNDEDAMQQTIEAFNAHGTDLPIDYEHQTLGGSYTSPNGQAPAAGWIRRLIAVRSEDEGRAEQLPHASPGLWAEVSWTKTAQTQLNEKSYRYLSPVVLIRKDDRRIAALHSVALTNKPAIVGMTPVINQEKTTHDGEVGGADALATELIALRDVLGLELDTDLYTLIATARHRMESSVDAEAQRQAQARVEAAMTAGKLCSAQREWAEQLALRDPAEFDRWETSAPALVELGRSVSSTVNDESTLTDGQVAAARSEYRANRTLLEKLCSEDAYAHAAART